MGAESFHPFTPQPHTFGMGAGGGYFLNPTILGGPPDPPAAPFPVPGLERLRRANPPEWLAEGAWQALAVATDALEGLGRRAGATYDLLEPILSEWRDRREARRP